MLNPIVKNVLYLAGGLLVGGGAGVFGSRQYFKKKYSKIADQQIKEMETYYGVADQYARPKVKVVDLDEEPHAENGRDQGVLSSEQRNEMRDWMKDRHVEKVDYTQKYRGAQVDPAEEHPDEDDGVEVVIPPRSSQPPHIVSEEDLGELPNYIDHQILEYYTYNDTLLEEQSEEMIENPEQLLGDCLEQGFLDDDDEVTLFVLNEELDTVYEVTKKFEAWEEGW